MLFRLDKDETTGEMSILIQSEKEPVWTMLNGFNEYVADCNCKEFRPVVKPDQALRFRLRANPTTRIKATGKREGILNTEDQITWLKKKGAQGGFTILDVSAVNEGISRDKMKRSENIGHTTSMLSVRFDGILRITDKETFIETLHSGIGSAKGFGFGLLSVAPLKE